MTPPCPARGEARNAALRAGHAVHAIVRCRDRAYLGEQKVPAMPETAAVAPSFSRPLLIVAAVAGILFAATAVLWAYYGTAVFYEMILAGIAACL
jgi:hypothetical protein